MLPSLSRCWTNQIFTPPAANMVYYIRTDEYYCDKQSKETLYDKQHKEAKETKDYREHSEKSSFYQSMINNTRCHLHYSNTVATTAKFYYLYR